MRIIVQKFGGTSLQTDVYRRAVVTRVREAREQGLTPVVVVSAMGRAGDPYATDTLIQVAKQVHPELPARELDLLMSCGEIISAAVMVSHFQREEIPAVVLTGWQAGIVTDRNFGNARILRVEPEHVRRHLERGDLVVVCGFQGASESGDITTLGRGGSDTTAAALGVALRAEVVEIYTDVDGIKTADPRLVPGARTLSVLSYEEVFQMAHQGAKVVHPRAIEIAMRANVPIRVRSTYEDGQGTLISHPFEQSGSWLPDSRIITGVTQIADVSRLEVLTHGTPGEDLRVFKPLAEAGISVDLINVSPGRKSFIVAAEDGERARKILTKGGFEVRLTPDCAKVSVVGSGMRGVPGVMAAIVEALTSANVEILQTADSHLTISCLVRKEDMAGAVQALHTQFKLDQ